MPSHAEFIATICKHPADMGPRLVYADWLEERGDVRGEFIRKSIELAEREPKLPRLLKAQSMNMPSPSISVRDEPTGSYRLRTPVLREPIRFEIVTEDMPSGIGSLVEVFAGGKQPMWINATVLDYRSNAREGRTVEYDVLLQMSEFRQQPLPERQEVRELDNRVTSMIIKQGFEWFRETFHGLDFGWRGEAMRDGFEFSMCRGREVTGPLYNCRFNKGFIESIELSFSDWQRHYKTLIDAMPVREVRLTTRPQLIRLYSKSYPASLFPGHDRERPIKFTLPAVPQPTGTYRTERPRTAEPIAR